VVGTRGFYQHVSRVRCPARRGLAVRDARTEGREFCQPQAVSRSRAARANRDRSFVVPPFRLVATFVDEAGKTRLTFRQIFETPAVRAKLSAFVPQANERNLDRLTVVVREARRQS
jgi:hypothetical protein